MRKQRMQAGGHRASGWVLATVAAGVAVAGLGALFGWLVGLNPGLTSALVAAVILAAVAVLVVWRRRRPARGRLTAVVEAYAVAAVAVFVLIQVIPYGRSHTNPPVAGEPAWSSPRTRQLMVDACYDCHSNEVLWPWYANIAPMSWAVTSHVDEGREAVNYSEFASSEGGDESVEVIEDGSMPPAYYTRFGLHPAANLSAAEIAELVAGLQATPGLGEDEDEDQAGD